MSDILEFADREEFRKWLSEHCLSTDGVWLLFGKAGGPKTIKAGEALEEALCFGWIDGQMKSIDDKTYKKYFSMRREKSKWSEKNKALVKILEERGCMTDFGRKKIEEAQKNGQWNAANAVEITAPYCETGACSGTKISKNCAYSHSADQGQKLCTGTGRLCG